MFCLRDETIMPKFVIAKLLFLCPPNLRMGGQS